MGKLFSAILLAILGVNKTNAIVSQSTTSSTRLFASDPTALFNADILRIASRTSSKNSSFDPAHAANHADRMLVQMLDMYNRSEKKTAKPNAETFRIVLKAFANLGGTQLENSSNPRESEISTMGLIERMESILARLDEFYNSQSDDDGDSIALTSTILDVILKAYARCSNQEVPHASITENTIISAQLPWLQHKLERGSNAVRAEKVLNYMIQHQDSYPFLAPTMSSYGYVVQAWSRQQPNAKKLMSKRILGSNEDNVCAKRGSKWLSQLESMYELEADADDSITGNQRRISRRTLMWAYSDALDAWARSDVKTSPKIANNYMKRIDELSAEDVADVKRIKTHRTEAGVADEGSGNIIYNNYVFGQEDIIYFEEKDVFLHEEYPLYPSDQCYTSTILALCRSRDAGATRRAHQLLNQMLDLYDSGNWIKNRPHLLSFNAVIAAYSKSSEPGSADTAEKILNKLEKLYFDPSKPKYNYLKPDTVSYNSAVTAWSRVDEEAAVYNAEEIVNRMESHFGEVGSKFLDVQPDAYTYNSLINAWIRSGLGSTSADNAEAILRSMIEKYDEGDQRFLPNQRIFCQIINAWGKCGIHGQDFPVKRALGLLDLMETMYREGAHGLKPDVITYSSLIGTISKSRLPNGSEMAMRLVEKMENMYHDGDKSMKPNVRSYSNVLMTLANSDSADKHVAAERILLQMDKLQISPNSYTYNYVINCAANSTPNDDKDKMEAFKVALSAFTALRKSSQATDSFTYAFFLKACGNLMEPSPMRSKIVTQTFQVCKKEGKVSNEVISRLTRCLDHAEIRSLLACKKGNIRNISTQDLDPKWSYNTNKR